MGKDYKTLETRLRLYFELIRYANISYLLSAGYLAVKCAHL